MVALFRFLTILHVLIAGVGVTLLLTSADQGRTNCWFEYPVPPISAVEPGPVDRVHPEIGVRLGIPTEQLIRFAPLPAVEPVTPAPGR